MRVLLTGATGYIGSAVLSSLLASGHAVVAPVRSAQKAQAVAERGATAVVADLSDGAEVRRLLRDSDAAIHTAADPEDAEGFDRGVAEAAVDAYTGTDRPYVHTGGAWVWGAGGAITEDDPLDPPAITRWRPRVQQVLDRSGIAHSTVHPGIVYGHGAGIVRVLVDAPHDDAGRLLTVGSGQQRWTTVHVDDLAALYVAVVQAGGGRGAVLGVGGDSPRVLDLSAAIADAAGVATEEDSATRRRLGDGLAEALLVDQAAAGTKARGIGGWTPTRAPLLQELAAGY